MRGQGRVQGRGQGRGFGLGPGGECVCPNCDHKEPHQLGIQCYNVKCPICGSSMTRV